MTTNKTDKLGPNSDGRDAAGRFARGNKLARNNGGRRDEARIRRALEAAADDDALRAIAARAVRDAKAGDRHARAFIFERLGGRVRLERDERTTEVELPAITDAASCVQATSAVLEAVGSGRVSLADGLAAMRLVDSAREAVVVAEVERRLELLERSTTLED